jgi:tetratricopeptide (TPR) repeat protein
MTYFGSLYREQGRYDEAEALYSEAPELQTGKLGPDHPDTLLTKSSIAEMHSYRENFDEAERLQLDVLERRVRLYGEFALDTAHSYYNLACLETRRGNPENALERLRQALDAGWRRADHLAEDPDLEPLHGPEFDALVERARQNAGGEGG